MKISSFKSFRRAILPASILAAMAFSGSASAFKVESDNPDLDIRWDNTFRYNAGWRMQDPSYYNKASGATSASDSKWKSGDMITNRLDDLSEFDFIWKKDTGFRVSAALWYDTVYGGAAPHGGAVALGGSAAPAPQANPGNLLAGAWLYPNGKYPNDVQRWYHQGAEFLDAFLFTKVDLGDIPVNLKLGKHTIYWGETLFSLTNGIAVGQSAVDIRKAVSTPGIEAKEVFLPVNQLTASAQISPELTAMGYYQLDWKPDRVMMGGTYFSALDFLNETTNWAPGGTTYGVGWAGTQGHVPKKVGAWGIAAKWRPEWLDGTAGFYYREYYPTASRQLPLILSGPLAGSAALYIDPTMPMTKMYAVSLAKQIWGISFGTDLSFKKDNAIAATTFSGVFPGTTYTPIADTWGFTQNMIAYDGKRSIPFTDVNMWDSAVLLAEFEYGAVDKITKNAGNAFQGQATFNNPSPFYGTNPGQGPSCGGGPATGASSRGGARGGCGTPYFYGINISLEPKWFQVYPGTDLTMPIFFGKGIHGNSFSYGPIEGAGGFSVGLAADVDAKYNFKLAYNGYLLKHNPGPTANAGLGDFSHKGNISFTAKATW